MPLRGSLMECASTNTWLFSSNMETKEQLSTARVITAISMPLVGPAELSDIALGHSSLSLTLTLSVCLNDGQAFGKAFGCTPSSTLQKSEKQKWRLGGSETAEAEDKDW
ncbi:hypothetical protein NQZ68_012014 [Dissostichus eleginoides]|nr:hypothetical protein NQZ68_012014 [Dissostichus eleginoides]